MSRDQENVCKSTCLASVDNSTMWQSEDEEAVQCLVAVMVRAGMWHRAIPAS